MNILVFGATGRVGKSVVVQALERGDTVTAFVRNMAKLPMLHPNLTIIEGDMAKPETVERAMKSTVDVVVGAIGADVMKPGSIVTDSTKVIVETMQKMGLKRYIGVSGTACMNASIMGSLGFAIMHISPIRYGVRDHENAFPIVKNSGLDWTLVGCPWIKDGQYIGKYTLSPNYFPGGMKQISPEDVADFIVKEAHEHTYPQEIVGIWY
jgi:putative NADH-flavin reductase